MMKPFRLLAAAAAALSLGVLAGSIPVGAQGSAGDGSPDARLSRGDAGPAVESLQALLNDAAAVEFETAAGLVVDGVATSAFEAYAGLQVDGIVES